MSTLRSPSTVSKSHLSTYCPGCGTALIAPVGTVCSICHKNQVWADAVSLVQEARKLLAGESPFDVLTREERAEQLQALGLERPSEQLVLRFPGFRNMSSEQLIAIVADPESNCVLNPGETLDDCVAEAAGELARRIDEPTPQERDEIEDRLATMEFEARAACL